MNYSWSAKGKWLQRKSCFHCVYFLLLKTKEEPTSVYTLCHRRTKGSYSMSLCKPDPSWIKYRHRSLAHRQVCYIRSYQDLCHENAPLLVKLCADKWLNPCVSAQINPVSSSTAERGNNCYNGRPSVSWQWTVPQWRDHWLLPKVSNLISNSWAVCKQTTASVELCWCVTVNQIPPPQSCCSCDRALPHLQQFLLQAADAEGQRQRRQHQGLVSTPKITGSQCSGFLLRSFCECSLRFFCKPVFVFPLNQMSETETAPKSEDVDTACGHFWEGLFVCACQSGVSLKSVTSSTVCLSLLLHIIFLFFSLEHIGI